MNRYGTLTRGGPSKATASTLCQKCLKRDIYECKAVAQERPYVSRPSRTQQLLNPKLLPKLSSDVPQDLLRKKGIADEQLAKIEQERGRKREQTEHITGSTGHLNGSRSTSSSSSASVATISTNTSKGSQRRRTTQIIPDRPLSSRSHMETSEKKRRRTNSSDGSGSSESEPNQKGPNLSNTRNTRRKLGEHSPLSRGRRRSRIDPRSQQASYSGSSQSPDRLDFRRGSKKASKWEVDDSAGSYHRGGDRRLKENAGSDAHDRQQIFQNGSISPSRRSRRKQTSPSEMDEGERKTANSKPIRHSRDRSFSDENLARRRYSGLNDRSGTNSKFNARGAGRSSHESKPIRETPRERSLSPFSKRSALTQAMNTGR